MARAWAREEDHLVNFWRKKMWKSIENSVKHLSNPHVAIAVIAVAPWLVVALLALLAFAFLRGGV